MKKRIIGAIALISLFTTVGYANNLLEGLGFVAPTIIGKANVFNPAVGEIVYDQVDATFYGYDHNDQWQAFGGAGTGTPTGVITAFAGTAAPVGYLLCDGSPVSRLTYASLYAVIGDSFGAGDGINTFNLPDLRGRFLRGVDAGAGNDSDSARTIGSVQDDAFQGHTFGSKATVALNSMGVINGRLLGDSQVSSSANMLAVKPLSQDSNAAGAFSNFIFTTNGVHGAPRVTSETRPKNVAVNYIIKI